MASLSVGAAAGIAADTCVTCARTAKFLWPALLLRIADSFKVHEQIVRLGAPAFDCIPV
jgi:hypothetical protein